MEFDTIYAIIISAAPALTSIIAVVSAVVSCIRKFKKVDGSLTSLQETNRAIIKENVALKKELQKVYKLHSEVVEHIAYKGHPADCTCDQCKKED